MSLTIREASLAEQKYTYSMSQGRSVLTGCIGHLRADMGKSGDEFYSSWEDRDKGRKTEDFKMELDTVINTLRFDERYEGILSNLHSLSQYCKAHPGGKIKESGEEYGFRIDTKRYSYLLRLNPQQNVYNLYCYCYEKRLLDHHMYCAEKGVRFIDSHYGDKFRLADGDKIRITHKDGSIDDRTCYYIDETHFELGGSWDNLYHIHQFAEQMEQMNSTVIPLRSSLPERCYALLPSSKDIIIIRKGETGYYETSIDTGNKEDNAAIVDEYNQALGVTKAQRQAMLCGSMFGWGVPGADPQNRSENGSISKITAKAREQER